MTKPFTVIQIQLYLCAFLANQLVKNDSRLYKVKKQQQFQCCLIQYTSKWLNLVVCCTPFLQKTFTIRPQLSTTFPHVSTLMREFASIDFQTCSLFHSEMRAKDLFFKRVPFIIRQDPKLYDNFLHSRVFTECPSGLFIMD